MVTLLGIDEREGGRSALSEEHTPSCLFCQGTGEGISVGEPPEALLEKLEEIVDVEGLPFISQYLNGQIDERLTSLSVPAGNDGLRFRFSLELANGAQLVV